jgi:hypothetical protein
MEMPNPIAEISQRNAARVAGFGYLAIIILGIFAEFFVRSKLIVPGEAATTANNILAAEGMFRIGIASDLLMLMFDVLVAWALYVLLKHVNQSLALLAAWFRLLHAAIYAITLLTLFFVLLLLSGADYLAAIETDKLHALVLLFLNGHSYGYDLGLVFFGLHCLVLGYLVFKSGYFPRVLGILLIGAALAYLTGSFTRFLFPDYLALISPIYVVALVAELSLSVWLLFKGVKIQASYDAAR